ncbi:MAG: alpha/beta fold hydrolase [Janthinobacterium lividum]
MIRADLPGPMRRRGPRPLVLHLAPPGQASLRTALTGSLGPEGPPPAWADPALLAGIAAYRRHPWQRTLPDPPALWTEGEVQLLDYGQDAAPHALPILFVPSLVNRAYVLDLLPDRSLLRWLAGQGLRPLLMDWGWPGDVERAMTLTDIITGPLERAITAVGGPVVLAGYCMGGLLTLAAALRRPEMVRALALLATPWDFHAAGRDQARRLSATLPLVEPLLTATGTLPVDALQTLFALPDPGAIAAKYRAFGRMDQAGDAARDFVALEDWLNDGVPLGARIARETLGVWYGENAPGRGEWRVAGCIVDPAAVSVPTFVAAPGRDRIVPSESALPLARLIPGAVLHQPKAGHVSMVAGPRARDALWLPLLHWLRTL